MPPFIKRHLPEIMLAVFVFSLVTMLWHIWDAKHSSRIEECRGRVAECEREDDEAKNQLPRKWRHTVDTVYPKDSE